MFLRKSRVSSSRAHVPATLVITSTSRWTSTTGSMKTGLLLLDFSFFNSRFFLQIIRLRVHNEHETDLRRTQIYVLTAIYYGGLLNFARLYALGMITRLNGWKRYDRDTYVEADIGELPPGEVMQLVWNGIPVFVRRLTQAEIKNENELPRSTLLDPNKEVVLTDAGTTKVLVCSAVCTHLGCIPIPYLGAYNGWVCICHGSVYDKFGRVRQGPALENLPYINNSIYDTILCIEEMKFPREPSTRFWA